jgi:hypothetical protein
MDLLTVVDVLMGVPVQAWPNSRDFPPPDVILLRTSSELIRQPAECLPEEVRKTLLKPNPDREHQANSRFSQHQLLKNLTCQIL